MGSGNIARLVMFSLRYAHDPCQQKYYALGTGTSLSGSHLQADVICTGGTGAVRIMERAPDPTLLPVNVDFDCSTGRMAFVVGNPPTALLFCDVLHDPNGVFTAWCGTVQGDVNGCSLSAAESIGWARLPDVQPRWQEQDCVNLVILIIGVRH